MLLKLEKKTVRKIIKDDPVRPHISLEKRTDDGREVYGLYKDSSLKALRAVICVAYTNEVPTNEFELELYTQAACQDGQHGSIAVFYTVWSYDKGAGRDIVFAVAEEIKTTRPNVKRFVTLSPLTEMARKFHLSNGAKLLDIHAECQNFEYELDN